MDQVKHKIARRPENFTSLIKNRHRQLLTRIGSSINSQTRPTSHCSHNQPKTRHNKMRNRMGSSTKLQDRLTSSQLVNVKGHSRTTRRQKCRPNKRFTHSWDKHKLYEGICLTTVWFVNVVNAKTKHHTTLTSMQRPNALLHVITILHHNLAAIKHQH